MFDDFKKADFLQGKVNNQFLVAAITGDLSLVARVLTQASLPRAQVNFDDGFAFISACQAGQLEVVKYLLKSPDLQEHCDIHAYNGLGLVSAYEANYLDVVQFLLYDMNMQMSPDTEQPTTEQDRTGLAHLIAKRDLFFSLHSEKDKQHHSCRVEPVLQPGTVKI